MHLAVRCSSSCAHLQSFRFSVAHLAIMSNHPQRFAILCGHFMAIALNQTTMARGEKHGSPLLSLPAFQRLRCTMAREAPSRCSMSLARLVGLKALSIWLVRWCAGNSTGNSSEKHVARNFNWKRHLFQCQLEAHVASNWKRRLVVARKPAATY